MPAQANNVKWEPWHYCGVCQGQFPISQLEWQRGALRCPADFDDLTTYRRERVIAEVIARPSNEMKPDPKLTNPQPDILEY